LRAHQAVEKGEALTGDQLNELDAEITRKYYAQDKGVCVVDDEVKAEWVLIPHFYSSYYVYQYATAVSASWGIHIDAPQIVSVLSFETVKDYEDYISRLRQIPRAFDQTTEQMRRGMADKLMPPKILVEKAVSQTHELASQKPEDIPFAQPFKKFPQRISSANQKRLREAALAVIRDEVLPVYAKLEKFLKDEYVPKGRTEMGDWALPDGEARYAFAVKEATTTTLAPEQIHQIGLQQVGEIANKMREVARREGHPDVKSFEAAAAKAPELFAHSRRRS